MNTTTNYSLPQWEAADRVTRGDFNDAMSAIDTAIAGAGVKIAAGTYHGDGTVTRTISLGFTPKAVFLINGEGEMYSYDSSYTYFYGGLFSPDAPITCPLGTVCAVVSGGFAVGYQESGRNCLYSNHPNLNYRYFAIG